MVQDQGTEDRQDGSRPESTVVLRLYVAGGTAKATEAIANLRAVCEEYLSGRYELEVVDVLVDRPTEATPRVVVTPTLLKVSPGPVQMVVGNLSQRATIIRALGLGDLDSDGE